MIQRTIRRWLERLDTKRGDIPIHLRPSGLTDERRVELQKEISNFREENPVCYTVNLPFSEAMNFCFINASVSVAFLAHLSLGPSIH